jgi:hypothetical protein
MLGPRAAGSWLTRFVFLRALGFVYVVAFLVLQTQMLPLFGAQGLMPLQPLVARLREYGFWQLPMLFWFDPSDAALRGAAGVGLLLALLVLLGAENALIMGALWAIYLSFVHAGQTFYGYGWETLLLESGFLAIFLCPVRHVLPLRDPSQPPALVVIMLRWLLFRLMFGAGLIKLRGDECWRDLTCLVYHYETQPVPHPLSWLLHQAPVWFHELGVVFNHFVELVVPWFVFGPRRARLIAGALTIVFQASLILSGNLSFLNWLTIAVALACFDDEFFARFLPRRLVARSRRLQEAPRPNAPRFWVVAALTALVGVLSIAPVMNLLSRRQAMNTSYDPLHLVNSYGAFGSIGKQRDEVIIEGTSAVRLGPDTQWQEYEFKCKPGDVRRRPCLITPFHYRLDWQMWFAALSNFDDEPWIVHLVYKLLRNDPGALSLLEKNPFSSAPPAHIRAARYRYRFTRFGEADGAWWRRERLGEYLPPLSLKNPELIGYLREQGFVR